MNLNARRLSILTPAEVDDLYDVPQFTDQDRHLYFALSPVEREVIDAVRTTSAAMHLILQLGYFKAKQRFFSFSREAVLDDLRFISQQYFPERELASIILPSAPTRLEQQRIILNLFDFRGCDKIARQDLEHKAQRIARLSTHPVYIFREVLQYLAQQRIVAPGYSFLQEMVGRVVARERQRISHLLGHALTPAVAAQLLALLHADEQRFRISALKHEPKDFSYKELRREVERRKFFQPLYEFAQTFLATTGISNESRKYYASLVTFYTLSKLQRMPPATTRLYLLCFAAHRFRQINDNLIEAFIHLVNQYEQQAKLAADEAWRKAQTEATGNLRAAGQVLSLFVDASIPDDATFATVKQKAFRLLDPARFPPVSDYMRNIAFDKTGFEWSAYTTLSPTFKRNLRHLFSDLEFAGRVEDAPLLEAVTFLQALLRQDKSPRQANPTAFPLAVIPKSLHRYLFATRDGKPKSLEVDRYEFLLYRLLRNALEAGDVFVADSIEFRRFEDDLISDARWQHKEVVLAEVGLPILLTPIQHTLAAWRATLEAQFKTVNQRITNGKNQYFKAAQNEKRRWKLVYPDAQEPINSLFYTHLPIVGIADLLWFVAQNTGFLRTFTHVLDRSVKHEPDPQAILACIVAMGTNMGLRKMAEATGLSHTLLLTTANNYLRLETLHNSNDGISNAIATLPAFHLYDIRDEIHSSSDGQRLETQIETLNARHSPKYFGLKKGVSSYTLVANHVPINAKIIGTHEHESHYVFDLLSNNTSDIKPERHSTDTHGTNQVNFWILHAFGYRFAPRYRDVYKKTDALVGFNPPRHEADFLIKPARQAALELIVTEWPNIQRIMASLAQKDVTQATIIRKLSSYSRQNQTKKALWELDNICRTLYILEFIDDADLRQRVQKALNRGEAYHRLRRAIAYVNAGKFRLQTEAQQQIWNECSRLIANAIIFYNTAVLSKVYQHKQTAGDQAAIDIIASVSPVAWQHVNLFGRFEFSPTTSHLNLDSLAACYDDSVAWNKALKHESDIL